MVAASSRTCTLLVVFLDFLCRGCLAVETYGYGDLPGVRAKEEFTYHEVVRPLIYVRGVRHRRSTTLHTKVNNNSISGLSKGQHLGNFTIHISAFSKNLTLDVKLNRELFSRSYIEKYFKDGKPIIRKPQGLTGGGCHYHGLVRGRPHSIVALSSCHGLRGLISTEEDVYYLEPSGESLQEEHLIFRHSDRLQYNLTCGFQDHTPDGASTKSHSAHSRLRRAVHWPYDTTSKTRIVELYVANDHQQYLNNQRSLPRVISRTQDIVNIVSSLYRPLNIYIALVGIEIWTDRDKSTIDDNADTTMNNFLEFRRKHICPIHKNDNAQLITGSQFTDGVVGKAVKSTICSYQYSGGVNMDHSNIVGPVATTVAHEMGHNFGMQHDDHLCDCPDDRCIMAASSGGKNPTHWSSCSKEELADSFHQGLDYCLHDLPEQLYGSGTCNNGFLDPGEECDCGLPKDCDNKCCNATTCQLLPNATCATGACCDLQTCQYRKTTTPCRPSSGECDLAEYCDGENEFCPHDVHVQNGNSCNNDEAFCFNGACPSHEGQCQKLWGRTGKVAHELCFKHFNPMGIANGHCGFNWKTKTFKRCEEKDVMCGMLHCEHRNEKLMFWKEALAYTMPEAWVKVDDQRFECKGAILDVGLDMPDPGMTPDGTKCDEGKMCVNQYCKSVEKHIQCPDCHGHGICNTLSQCHCDAGYSPPLCDKKGNGGSLHSGPASQPSNNAGVVAGVVILILILISGGLVLGYFAHRNRQQLKKFWDNRRPYKYESRNNTSFIHRAKRSEPARANSTPTSQPPAAARTPTRPAPSAPPLPVLPTAVVQPKQSFSKRQRPQSFRGVPISAPRLESTTKSVEDNPTMRSVGPRARPLPPIPSETGGDLGGDARSPPGGSGGGGSAPLHQRAPVPVAEVQPQPSSTSSRTHTPPASSSHLQKQHPSAITTTTSSPLPTIADHSDHGANTKRNRSSSPPPSSSSTANPNQGSNNKLPPERPPPTYRDRDAGPPERPSSPPPNYRDCVGDTVPALPPGRNAPNRTSSFQQPEVQVLPPPPSYPPPREPGQSTLNKPHKNLPRTQSSGQNNTTGRGPTHGPNKRLSRQLSSPTPTGPASKRLSSVPNGDAFSTLGKNPVPPPKPSQGPDSHRDSNKSSANPTAVTFSTLKQRFENDPAEVPGGPKGAVSKPPVTRSVSMKGIKPPPPPKSAAVMDRQNSSEC